MFQHINRVVKKETVSSRRNVFHVLSKLFVLSWVIGLFSTHGSVNEVL